MIKTGLIVNVLGNAGNGIYGAKYVDILFPGHAHAIKAYAKPLNDMDILVEIISALIGRELDLPIPEPALGFDEDTDSTWFVSVDMKVPDLSRHLNIDANTIAPCDKNLKILDKLCQWPHIYHAIGFDEWIANGDRNIGNILYDGGDDFFLIDHNRAMRLPFYPEEPINNHLLKIKLYLTPDDVGRQRIKNHIEAMTNNTDQALPDTLINTLKETLQDFDPEILDKIAEFLQKRLNYVFKITASQIPTQQRVL